MQSILICSSYVCEIILNTGLVNTESLPLGKTHTHPHKDYNPKVQKPFSLVDSIRFTL